MNTCGDRRLRPGATGLFTRARESACEVSCGGRHLGSRKLGCIDVLRGERTHAVGNRRSRAMPGGREEVSEGSNRRLADLLTRQRRTHPRTRKANPAWLPFDPKPAPCRQARSRRRPDRRKVVWRRSRTDRRRRPDLDRPRSRTLAVPTTALGGESPEAAVQASARDVNVDCRSGVETSWLRLRGKAARPYERRSRSDGRGPRSGRDLRSSVLAKGCPGSVVVERQARSPEQRSLLNKLAPLSCRNRIRGRRVGS